MAVSAVVALLETGLDLSVSALTAIRQMVVSSNIPWDFDVLGKVIRKRGMFTVVVPSARDGRVAVTSSAGVETGRCRINAFTGFWDMG
jgi:ribose/xylose/arabinose/galactoside ABC-type transport system permease subunit